MTTTKKRIEGVVIGVFLGFGEEVRLLSFPEIREMPRPRRAALRNSTPT